MLSVLKEGDKKSMHNMHLAFTIVPMLLCVATYFLMQEKGEFDYNTKSIYFIISAILILIAILAGTKIYITNINHALKNNYKSYEDAMMIFRSANLIKWILLEATVTIGIICAFLDNNPFIFFPVIAGLFFLFTSKMKEEHFENFRF